MRHRGWHVGNFYLVEKEGGAAFTDDDEETLVLFGAQAAASIANARADLEALVETSPVGVAVFDAASGRAVSFNREARRIGETLHAPDRPPPDCPPEELLSILTLRRADGREIALAEYPIAQALGSGETVRAKETYETHLYKVWSDRSNGNTRVVRAIAKQLRDDVANPSLIFNMRGGGYRLPRPGEPPGA